MMIKPRESISTTTRNKPLNQRSSPQTTSTLKWGSRGLHKQAKLQDGDKQRKYFEQLLHAWEALEAKERENKLNMLKRRVDLQRQLIKKVDKQHQIKIQHKQEYETKKKDKKKASIHYNRATPKCTIKAKLVVAPVVIVSSDHILEEQSDTLTKETHKDAVSNGNREQEKLFQSPAENKILKYLGVEQKHHEDIKIEEMWYHLKLFSDRKLKPMQTHLDKLKRVASPSVKECLDIYDRPTNKDILTGKPIVLSDALNSLRKPPGSDKGHILRLSRSSATLKSKCGQTLLEKATTSLVDSNDFWFVDLQRVNRPHSAPDLTETIQSLPQHSVGPRLCFLKDHTVSMNTSITPQEHIKKTIQFETHKTPSNINWYPLSLSALSEYSGVKERVTSGHGMFRNGSPSLWKQT